MAAIFTTANSRSISRSLFARLIGWAQYRTPIKGLYLCGAGTHPGGGVTGGPGANAARESLRTSRLKGVLQLELGTLLQQFHWEMIHARQSTSTKHESHSNLKQFVMTKQVRPSRSFASDNNAGVHPKIMEAIAAANDGHVSCLWRRSLHGARGQAVSPGARRRNGSLFRFWRHRRKRVGTQSSH